MKKFWICLYFFSFAVSVILPYIAKAAIVGRSNKATIDITATVQPSCTVVAGDLYFEITNFSKNQSYQGTAALNVLCTKDTKFVIGLDNGTSPGATVLNRKMKNRSSYLNYSLYKDSSNIMVWGNIGGNSLVGVATGQRQIFIIYAKIPAGQKSVPGKYLDSISVTVNLGSDSTRLSYQLSVPMNVILKNTETPGYNNM